MKSTYKRPIAALAAVLMLALGMASAHAHDDKDHGAMAQSAITVTGAWARPTIAKMRPVDSVAIAPGTPVVFQPGGYHVMIMGLKGPLNEGDSFPLTLTFEKAGDVTVHVTVMKKAAQGHGNMDHGAHKH